MTNVQFNHRPLDRQRFRAAPDVQNVGRRMKLMRLRITRTTIIVRREIREAFYLVDDHDHRYEVPEEMETEHQPAMHEDESAQSHRIANEVKPVRIAG